MLQFNGHLDPKLVFNPEFTVSGKKIPEYSEKGLFYFINKLLVG